MEKYTLTVTTGKRYPKAGTDKTVQAKIVGETGKETSWHTLDYFWENDFEAGSVRAYEVHHRKEPVGKPLVLKLRLTGFSFDQEWLCDLVVVEYQDIKYTFPVYRWLNDGVVSVAPGEGALPQNVTQEVVKKLRSDEIAANKEVFKWNPKPTSEADPGWEINRYLDDNVPLPLVYENTLGQDGRTSDSVFSIALNTAAVLFTGFCPLDELEDYEKLYEGSGIENPPFISRWKTDEEFGRQVLTGISPLAMERCKSIPSYFNVTNSTVSSQLGAGKTLEGEIEAGKVFIADYSWAKDIPRNVHGTTRKAFYSANCIGLFHASESGEFLPLAIQLAPNESDSLFTPADSEYDWLLAKMYFRCAAASSHEWYYHWMMTHAMSETFSVATFRNLPHCHPLYKLLRPHLKFVANINRLARSALLPPDSAAGKSVALNAMDTVRYYFKTFKLSDLDIPNRIASQGLESKNILPNYQYREDAMEVWAALNSYVTGVVEYFYKADSDVIGDFELQAWASDLANEGFGYNEDGNTKGMPESITTRSELIRICNIIIFASSAQHAAVNFGQMETYQFVPNAPTSMRLPPHKRGEADLKRVLDSLPDRETGYFMLTMAYALSEYSKDEVFLGDVYEQQFVTDEVKTMQNDFKKTLDQLNAKFSARNAEGDNPYWYLLPSKIPININI